jgi:hypothetical protein
VKHREVYRGPLMIYTDGAAWYRIKNEGELRFFAEHPLYAQGHDDGYQILTPEHNDGECEQFRPKGQS